MRLNLGNLPEAPVAPTDSLLKGMDENTNSEQENQYLEMLYFQFGRYLLISSSREGSLPANLQGVWGERLSNPWNADYHTNIKMCIRDRLNKPAKEVAAVWDDKLVELTGSARQFDPTRDFLTLDGDRDMDGRLPVWSKHFSHGLKLDDLPKGLNPPLIVGESGATYYGLRHQLYPFVGEKAYLLSLIHI